MLKIYVGKLIRYSEFKLVLRPTEIGLLGCLALNSARQNFDDDADPATRNFNVLWYMQLKSHYAIVQCIVIL